MDRKTIRRRADTLRRKVLEGVKRRFPDASNARKFLHPRYAAELLGYSYEEHSDLDLMLGIVGSRSRVRRAVVWGFFDRNEKRIAVSDRLPEDARLFTGLHEIGHVLLHKEQLREHRDRPIELGEPKAPLEWEADQFAKEYAMPEAWVRADVRAKFEQTPIEPDDDLYWRLDPNEPERFSRPATDDLMLEKLIAKHTNFGQHRSLKDEYGVTTMAMAVRLKETGLVKRT